MSCQIIYNSKGVVEKVYALNGSESILYKETLKTNAAEDAVKIWSVSQTPMFKEEVQPKDSDQNNEPNLKTVLAYISTKNTTEQLTNQEIFEVGQSLIGTNFTNANELAVQLKEALLIPTKQTLSSLNLYNNSEISDILNDPILKNKILETAQKIINTDAEITQNTEVNSDYIRVNPNLRDALGKYQINNPNILEANIIQELGGIKNEDEFNQKLQDSGFEVGKNPDNSQNKATTELVTEYLKAKLGQDISILPESEMLKELQKRGFSSLQGMMESYNDYIKNKIVIGSAVDENNIFFEGVSNVLIDLFFENPQYFNSHPELFIEGGEGVIKHYKESSFFKGKILSFFKDLFVGQSNDNNFIKISKEDRESIKKLSEKYIFNKLPSLRAKIIKIKDLKLPKNIKALHSIDAFSDRGIFEIIDYLEEGVFKNNQETLESITFIDSNLPNEIGQNSHFFIELNDTTNFFGYTKNDSLSAISKFDENIKGINRGNVIQNPSEIKKDILNIQRQEVEVDNGYGYYRTEKIFHNEALAIISKKNISSITINKKDIAISYYQDYEDIVDRLEILSKKYNIPIKYTNFQESTEGQIQFSVKPLGTQDKVHGFYDQNTKQTFLTEEFLSSESLIHEMWHSVKPSIKISAKKDKTAELLLKTMNNLVNETGFNEKQVREEYKASNKNGVGVNPMIIGESGASRLSNAVTVLENLQVAKEMQSQNKDAKTIKLATGWEYNSTEKKWKTETEDINLKDVEVELNKEYDFSDIMNENEFTKAYPNLKNYKIIFNNEGNNSFSPSKNTIELDMFGSVNSMVSKEYNATNPIKTRERFTGKLWELARRNLIHELTHVSARLEGFSSGGTDITISERARELASINDEDTGEVSKTKIRDAISITTNQSDLNILNLTLGFFEGDNSAFYKGYENLAGEVEARNASKRIKYTLQEKLTTLLSETEQISEEDKIYLQQSGESFSQAYAPRQNESENEYVDRMREEVEANLLGENSVAYFDRIAKENNLTDKEKASFISKVKAFIKSFSDWLTKQIGFENLTPEQASKLTTKDVLDRVTTSILKGQYKNSLFEDLSKYNRISVVENINGAISPKKDNKVTETIKATLQEDENGTVRNAISDLEGYSNAVWTSSPQAVKTLLKSLENKAKNISLDLEGLESSYNVKSQEEILNLLRSLDYLLNNINEENQNYFINTFEEFFNIKKQDEVAIELVDEKFRNKPLVKLETKDSDYKVFKELGLLRVGKNIYMKTDALKKSLQEVEDLMLANKMEISEDEMYKEYTSDTDYDLDTLKKLASYRMYFGAEDIKTEQSEIRVPQIKIELLAPNGKVSKLTPQQHAQVRTPQFKAWFGDWELDPENASKVVDKNGEPLVVYHGTNAEFSEFRNKKGIRGNQFTGAREVTSDTYFFTDNIEYADKASSIRMENFGGSRNIVASFLNIKTPLDFTTFDYKTEELFNEFTGEYPSQYFGYNDNLDQWWRLFDKDEDDITEDVKSKGYSGVMLAEESKSVKDNKGYDIEVASIKSFGVFSPNQIKSAETNNGEFSLESNNIHFMVKQVEYLKTDFIGDLYKEYLKDKSNPVLSNLQFGEKGITLKNTDPISILELNNYLENNQNLKNYLQLNRNTDFEITTDNDNIISERDELVNGKVKEEFQDNFRKINDDVIQAETYENFITINKENFEKVQDNFFVKLPSNTTEFYQLDNEQPQLRINPDDYISQKAVSQIEIKNKYSKLEGEIIDELIGCSK